MESPSPSPSPLPTKEITIASKESVTHYVKTAGLAILGALDHAAQLELILEESEAVVKFITDPQTHVLVVDRTVHRGWFDFFSLKFF
ncbi:unnamed protein product [Nippostrongylus brasiliensis]|uniref:Robl_LC7 domain-containing protein n=1 Tax=Nippostrongylus brasiliensis TaxID=27835 RepID=A0A0N4XMP8_NIPBR|nr:unnamed protein product [Nippostrongylus brasiliensis]